MQKASEEVSELRSVVAGERSSWRLCVPSRLNAVCEKKIRKYIKTRKKSFVVSRRFSTTTEANFPIKRRDK